MAKRLLIVDDEENLCKQLARFFTMKGYAVESAHDGAAALQALTTFAPEVVLLDLRLPDQSGIDLLQRIKREQPGTGVVMFTAYGDVDTAVRATQLGADHFVLKPVKLDSLEALVERILSTYRSQAEVTYLRGRLDEFRGKDKVQRLLLPPAVKEAITLLAENPGTNVLILGETGTGKGMVANAIHALSPRAEEPFVDVNCAGLSSQLLESELFGHERGAFTDAKSLKRGLLEVAHGGSLFLDEVGDLSLDVQAKLLKVIEDRRFRRLGGTANLKVDVRLMAATNVELERAVKEGRFRADLYYRLTVIPIHLPPLRQRPEDIVPLAQLFREEFSQSLSKPIQGIAPAAEAMLGAYAWPGNIRELRNVMERAALLCPGTAILPGHLPEGLRARSRAAPSLTDDDLSLEAVERSHIQRILALCGGNRSRAAGMLRIHRATLIKKIQRYQIDG